MRQFGTRSPLLLPIFGILASLALVACADVGESAAAQQQFVTEQGHAPDFSTKLLFISNGEAGVYLSEAVDEFKATASEEPQDITLLGKLRFDDLQSVNHVAYEGDTLFVAAGLGGLKIVKVD